MRSAQAQGPGPSGSRGVDTPKETPLKETPLSKTPFRAPTHRVITGLQSVAPALAPPFPRPKAGTGARGAGLRYERALARALPQALAGLWLEFRDSAGPGFCQPDLILRDYPLRGALYTVVLECKITWTPNGHLQLEQLYTPILAKLWGRPVVGVVVSKHLTSATPLSWVHSDLSAALDSALLTGRRSVWHWLGRSTGPGPRLGLSEALSRLQA